MSIAGMTDVAQAQPSSACRIAQEAANHHFRRRMSSSENFAARLAFRSSTADQPPLGVQLATLRHLNRFFAQVWRTSPPLMVASIVLRLFSALQPLLLLYIGKLIIDEVVRQTGMP